MKRVKLIDNTKKFLSINEESLDQALQTMAIDVETLAKVKKVPQKSSRLQGTIVHKRIGRLKWIVPADTKYARFQEFGGDSKRRIRNYSKPGTGAHYLRDSGNTVKKNFIRYIKQRINNIKL